MNHRVIFWLNTSRWPRDSASHIFLARAVHAFGSAMFPGQWEAKDPGIVLIRPLPKSPPRQPGGESYQAHELLVRHRPDFGRKALTSFKRTPDGLTPVRSEIPPFSSDEWRAAYSLVEKLNEKVSPGFSRFTAVQHEIIKLTEAGKLVTGIRQQRGGQVNEIPSWMWNSERILNRFDLCALDPNDPFGLASTGDGFWLIFVTRDSLATSLSALEPTAKQTINLQRECQRWLEEQFALSETERWSKGNFHKKATGRFGNGLGARMFQRAWAAAVEKPGFENRRRAGAKSKLDS
jgi:hypothetical protein